MGLGGQRIAAELKKREIAHVQTLNHEGLAGRTFNRLAQVHAALDRYLTYYNNHRLHSRLGGQAPVTRYAGRLVAVRGLAGSLGLEPLAADPPWRPTAWDPPVEITPLTALASRALASLHERSTCG